MQTCSSPTDKLPATTFNLMPNKVARNPYLGFRSAKGVEGAKNIVPLDEFFLEFMKSSLISSVCLPGDRAASLEISGLAAISSFRSSWAK